MKERKMDNIITVNVTNRDALNATDNEPGAISETSCPVYQALHRMFPDVEINVGPRYVQLDGTTYTLPKVARDYIGRRDGDLPHTSGYHSTSCAFDMVKTI